MVFVCVCVCVCVLACRLAHGADATRHAVDLLFTCQSTRFAVHMPNGASVHVTSWSLGQHRRPGIGGSGCQHGGRAKLAPSHPTHPDLDVRRVAVEAAPHGAELGEVHLATLVKVKRREHILLVRERNRERAGQATGVGVNCTGLGRQACSASGKVDVEFTPCGSQRHAACRAGTHGKACGLRHVLGATGGSVPVL